MRARRAPSPAACHEVAVDEERGNEGMCLGTCMLFRALARCATEVFPRATRRARGRRRGRDGETERRRDGGEGREQRQRE